MYLALASPVPENPRSIDSDITVGESALARLRLKPKDERIRERSESFGTLALSAREIRIEQGILICQSCLYQVLFSYVDSPSSCIAESSPIERGDG